MYKLTFSPASPYVRKVLLSAYRVGIEDQMKLVTTDSQDDNLLRSQILLEKSQFYKNQMDLFYLIAE